MTVIPKGNDTWNWSDHVEVGDVVAIQKGESRILNVPEGNYVVEDAQQLGGWTVMARKLSPKGKYIYDNPIIQFRQCPGYKDSLIGNFILVLRRMKRVFV